MIAKCAETNEEADSSTASTAEVGIIRIADFSYVFEEGIGSGGSSKWMEKEKGGDEDAERGSMVFPFAPEKPASARVFG